MTHRQTWMWQASSSPGSSPLPFTTVTHSVCGTFPPAERAPNTDRARAASRVALRASRQCADTLIFSLDICHTRLFIERQKGVTGPCGRACSQSGASIVAAAWRRPTIIRTYGPSARPTTKRGERERETLPLVKRRAPERTGRCSLKTTNQDEAEMR